MVILWDLATDGKTNLLEHEADIVCVKFSEDGKYLFTVDGGLTPSLCLWSLSGPALLQHVYLPSKLRKVPIKNALALDSKTTNLLLVLENESEGYRVSCWDLSKSTLNFMSVSELDSASNCKELFFTNPATSVFCTAEDAVLKLWRIGSTGCKAEQRIHLPQKIATGTVCLLSGAFAVLTCLGSIVVLAADVTLAFCWGV